MTAQALSENTNTINLVVDTSLDLRRYRRAMYNSRELNFTHAGSEYSGAVVSVRPHVEPGPPAWLVKILAKPHVARLLKRPQLRWTRRSNGEVVVY